MYHVHSPEDKILYIVTEVSQLIHTAFAALYFMGAYHRPRPGWEKIREIARELHPSVSLVKRRRTQMNKAVIFGFWAAVPI